MVVEVSIGSKAAELLRIGPMVEGPASGVKRWRAGERQRTEEAEHRSTKHNALLPRGLGPYAASNIGSLESAASNTANTTNTAKEKKPFLLFPYRDDISGVLGDLDRTP